MGEVGASPDFLTRLPHSSSRRWLAAWSWNCSVWIALPSRPRSPLWRDLSRLLSTMFSSSTPSGRSVIAPVPEPLPCVAGPMWVLLAFAMMVLRWMARVSGRDRSGAATDERAAAAEAAGAPGNIPIIRPKPAAVIVAPVGRPAPAEFAAAGLVLEALVDAERAADGGALPA